MVLFYEHTPAELYDCTREELVKRLYKVTIMSALTFKRSNGKSNKYGILTLKHHQEARPAGELKAKNGEWTQQEEYRPGDIVAFYVLHEGQAVCVTHRIVERTAEETYITKGDANDREDRMVIRKGQIAGIVTEYIPWFGYICFFVQKNSTLLLVLFLFSLLWKG